jgi:hypothetical protein
MNRQNNWSSLLLWAIYVALLAVLLPHLTPSLAFLIAILMKLERSYALIGTIPTGRTGVKEELAKWPSISLTQPKVRPVAL